MRNYQERLRVPASWWVLGEFTAFILASTAWAGFSYLVAVACYVAFCGGLAALLLAWGATTVTVTGSVLRAGPAALSLADTGEVVALDEAQSKVLRGPGADPLAFMLLRPYLARAVYVEVTAANVQAPYWLLGTRKPAELAAAIERARPQARAGGPAMR